MKLFLTPKEVWEREGYGGKCAIIGVIGAMIFAISLAVVTDDMPRNETSEFDPVVNQAQVTQQSNKPISQVVFEQTVKKGDKYDHHLMEVKQLGNCYSYGNVHGSWVHDGCFSTFDEAYAEKIDMEDYLATSRAHEQADWKAVSE